MARRPNYGFEKRQREIKKQKKKAEKAERKRLRKEGADGGEGADSGPEQDDVELEDGADHAEDELPWSDGRRRP